MTEPLVSVVVMAYNEADALEAVVHELHEALIQLGESFEVLVVNDGSSDATGAVAARLGEHLRDVRVLHHPGNLGLGGVYRTGFAQASGRFVTFFPADGQFPASIIHTFVDRMSDCDLVLGFVDPGCRLPLERLLSWGERCLYNALLGPIPRFQGVLMFRRSLLAGTPLRSSGRGWGILMEFIVRTVRRGHRVRSIPTPYRPRATGQSKVTNPRTVLVNLREILSLAWFARVERAEGGPWQGDPSAGRLGPADST